MIYHVTTPDAWRNAIEEGAYSAPSLKDEGFIHCSRREQIAGVLERYYSGKSGLILLHIREEMLGDKLKFEYADSVAEEFPHVYGPIPVGAVTGTEQLN